MFDAGNARSDTLSESHIKHVHCFESKVICKLIQSKDYIGRGHVSKLNPTVYIKNKKICDLIDKLRYYDGDKRIIEARTKLAKIHYDKFTSPFLNGGPANAIYAMDQVIDLGNASPPSATKDEPCEYIHKDKHIREIISIPHDNTAAILHYDSYKHCLLDGGGARSVYSIKESIDLGDSGFFNTSQPAILNNPEITQRYLDGGSAVTAYFSASQLIDLGNSSAPSIMNESAILHDPTFAGSLLDGGLASSLYGIGNITDLGNASSPSNMNLSAIINDSTYTDAFLDGGYSITTYTINTIINLGNAG